jgi:hypothetical protein
MSASALAMASSILFGTQSAHYYYKFDGAPATSDADDDQFPDSALEAASTLQSFANATSAEATDALICHVLQAR